MVNRKDTLRRELLPVAAKTRITIMLDDDVIEHFRELGQSEGIGYQTKINAALRDVIAQSGKRKRDMPITAGDLKKVLRKVVREEIRKR